MSKKVKMILYGEPGTGKSVFAGNAPKPFFLTTDGNYEWLEGLVPNFDEKNHIQLNSWYEAQEVFKRLDTDEFKDYETIVVDLTEDLYRWADVELCEKSKVKHISELGDYGKGYDILRKPFIATMTKLLAVDKNIILLSHETSYEVKDKKGVTTTKYQPSKVMNLESVWDKICGQVRFCIRCFKDYEQDENGHTKVKRLLHLINQPEEYGTFRISDPNTPETIQLDWNEFANTIGLNSKLDSIKKDTVNVEKPVVAKKETTAEAVTEKSSVVETKVTESVVDKTETTEKVVEETDSAQTIVKEEKVEVAQPTVADENPNPTKIVVDVDFLSKCLDEGLKNISDIESKYGISIEQKLKVEFIKLKMAKMKK